jgi:hypothetical protein
MAFSNSFSTVNPPYPESNTPMGAAFSSMIAKQGAETQIKKS